MATVDSSNIIHVNFKPGQKGVTGYEQSKPNVEIIKILEDLLVVAKAGELHGLAGIGNLLDSVDHFSAGSFGTDPADATLQLYALTQRIR